jgi:hypothetical protein
MIFKNFNNCTYKDKKTALVGLLCLFNSIISFSQKPLEIMQPKEEFNVQQAMEMLNEGSAEIKGVAYYEDRTPIGIKVGETIYARSGEVVFLYPLTAYIEEYLSLKKKNKQGKRMAAISPLANCFRVESKVYSQTGDFAFVGLKPGKYYLETMVYFPSGIGGRETTGIVEIKTDGEVVSCKLKYIY